MQTNKDIRLIKSNQNVWSQTEELLKKSLSQPSFESWIKPIKLHSIKPNGEVVLHVANEFMRGMVLNNYKEPLLDALSTVIQEKISLTVEVGSTDESSYTGTIASIQSAVPSASIPAPTPAPAQPANAFPQRTAARTGMESSTGIGTIDLKQRSNLNPKYTFGTFVVGSHNRFCHSAAAAVAQKPGQSYNPLFIYGGVGLGKTHIMQAVGHEILNHSPQLTIKYISCERFTNDLINSIRDDRMADFRKRYRQVDVLLVDDIQFIEGKESTQEEFFHTFNALRDSGKQIIMTSDRPPKALTLLEERLRSRFEWGLITDIQIPDIETRVAILQKKCHMDNIQVPEPILNHIASTFTTNIRELEGALIRVHAYSSLTGEHVEPGSLNNILLPSTPGKEKTVLTMDKVLGAVCAAYQVEPSELKSKRRSQDLTVPRHVAMYLAYELLEMSYPRIGEVFGNRKHTSAIYACSKIKDGLAKDTKLATTIAQIRQQLGH